MNYHNPEQLSKWGQADGWRLLTTEEKILPGDAEFYDACEGEWFASGRRRMNRVEGVTYRTKKPLPVSPLITQLDAEVKAKQELKEITLAVEAGAEWEVDSGTGTDWHKPDYEFAWYFREDRACAWQVRLKPKPVTELSADLTAEKDKEIAELRAWKESALKVMPDFQKLGKLLGLPLGSDVSEQLVPAVEKQTALLDEVKRVLTYAIKGLERFHSDVLSWKDVKVIVHDPAPNHLHIHQALNQLLTRLGGSSNE